MGDQPYQQPYQQPMQPPSQSAGAKWGPTSMGMEAHIAAGVSYLTPVAGLIFFLMEKNNRFVKFHAMQSMILGVLYIVVFVALLIVDTIIGTAASAVDSTGTLALVTGCLSICVFGLVPLAFLGLWIWGLIAGFTGKYVKFPIIGNIAESWAGGPATPAY